MVYISIHRGTHMQSPELSSRTENLYKTQIIIGSLDKVSVPRFIEIPSQYFDSLAIPKLADPSSIKSNKFEKPSDEIVEHYLEQLEAQSKFDTIDKTLDPLVKDGPIIVRCAPIVPYSKSVISYAGIYPSFVPKPIPHTQEGIHKAVASVIAGKHSGYADYYNARHNASDRRLGILVMELISSPAVHGTAYSFNGNLRSEHVYDPSLDSGQYAAQYGATHYVKDAFGITENIGDNEFCAQVDFKDRLSELCTELESKFAHPIDTEYLIDASGVIHVVQVRELSDVHKTNWAKYYQQDKDQVNVKGNTERRAIINSVGRIVGNTVMTNSSNIERVVHDHGKESGIVVLDNGVTEDLIKELGKQDKKGALSIVIQHGKDRIRDHFQYSLFEDPAITQLIHVDPDNVDDISAGLNHYSNGDIVVKN